MLHPRLHPPVARPIVRHQRGYFARLAILGLAVTASSSTLACSRDGEGFGLLPPDRTAIRNTQAGSLVGEHIPARDDLGLPGIDIYRGIPYAAPPVGAQRWRPPQDPEPWQGVREAIAFGANCPQPQRTNAANQAASNDSPPAIDEDCLTLNIWTTSDRSGQRPNPTIVEESRPVLVWIHGGGFRIGSGSAPALDGSRFVADGAVLVTINYRLGALGFLAHPELLAEHSAANFGLLDMRHALVWVKNNIGEFGGDNNNVTIIGESAGGMAVQLLMARKQVTFQQAISMSGYGTWPLPRVPNLIPEGQTSALANPYGNRAKAPIVNAVTLGEAIIARARMAAAELSSFGQLQTSLDDSSGEATSKINLRDLPVASLIDAVDSLHLPIVDGSSLADEPAVVFAQGAQAQVPFLAGGNSYDGAVMAMANLDPAVFFAGWGKWQSDLRELYAQDFSVSDELGASRLFGDGRYLLASRRLARSMSTVNQPGFLYYYDWIPEQYQETWPGAPHASEIRSLFAAPTLDPPPEASRKVGQGLRHLFLEFARLRKPAGSDWPAYTDTNHSWFTIRRDGSMGVETATLDAKLNFLEQRYEERLEAQGLLSNAP